MTTAASPVNAATGRELLDAARRHEKEIVSFLRDMIAIPAESGKEKERCERVLAEYKRLGFECFFDGLGTVVAKIGNGPLKILMDGHIDCVGVGDPSAWKHDPFKGKLEDGKVWGRGAVDELPSIACMAHGAALAKEKGVFPADVTLYLSASVMEEDCDGLCLMHLIEKEGIRPDVVVIGEPTDMAVYRGHRGRMEMTITTKGVSAHGAHADRGVNAVYKMGPILKDVEELNARLKHDAFLGKGSIIVSYIESKTPSLCAVPDECRVYLDRRMTAGETVAQALAEVRALPHLGDAEVTLLNYDAVAWTGKKVSQEKSFPTWVLPEEHPLVQGLAEAVGAVLGKRPAIGRWHFSTNGVACAGRLGIPSVGFAPGLEELSHSTGEWVAVDDLVKAAAAYALMPAALAERKEALCAR